MRDNIIGIVLIGVLGCVLVGLFVAGKQKGELDQIRETQDIEVRLDAIENFLVQQRNLNTQVIDAFNKTQSIYE